MMKRIKRIGLASLICLLLFVGIGCVATTSKAQETNPQVARLVDDASLLSEKEAGKIMDALNEVSKRQKLDVVIYTTSEGISKTAQDAADDYYDYNGFGYGDNYDGVLLYINMKTRDWSISTCGYGITVFTDAGIEYISDIIVEKLGDEEYYDALNSFVELSDEFVTEAKENKPYDVGHMPKGKLPLFRNILIALIAGVVVAGLYCLYLWNKLKSVAPNNRAKDYVVRDSMNIKESYDMFLYHTVHATKKESKSSSGGSSIHTSSSGRSHGGGSGKF